MLELFMKGGKPLSGEVTIGGAKNAALGIVAAAIMTDDPVTLENLPAVSDIRVMLTAIRQIGARVEYIDAHTVRIEPAGIFTQSVMGAEVRKIRASYYLIGALLGKYKKAEVALPGGCAIGARPIDQHLKGFRALGASSEVTSQGALLATADQLVGQSIAMDVVSVGATINIMLAACLAEGKTVIECAAKEPHVVDVAIMLNSMGADIKGAGTDKIRIRGVKKLHGTTHNIVPDQIEAGTFMMAAAATRGNVLLRNVIPRHLEVISIKLREIGCQVVEEDDTVRVIGCEHMKGTRIETSPYPGFPTDMQPQAATVLTLADGASQINEGIFESRFAYTEDLQSMGANIRVCDKGDCATIEGVEKLHGAAVKAHDLRAGAALTIAGLAAEGYTAITEIQYILRGYENFDKKLRGLGAQIAMVEDEAEKYRFVIETGGNPDTDIL